MRGRNKEIEMEKIEKRKDVEREKIGEGMKDRKIRNGKTEEERKKKKKRV